MNVIIDTSLLASRSTLTDSNQTAEDQTSVRVAASQFISSFEPNPIYRMAQIKALTQTPLLDKALQARFTSRFGYDTDAKKLYAAAEHGQLDYFKSLFESGELFLMPLSSLFEATQQELSEIVRAVSDGGCKVTHLIEVAAEKGQTNIVRWILENEQHINDKLSPIINYFQSRQLSLEIPSLVSTAINASVIHGQFEVVEFRFSRDNQILNSLNNFYISLVEVIVGASENKKAFIRY